MRITVVGAGIVGMTAALRLREAGHDVRIVADRLPEESTSSVAAALWLPYLVEPEDKALRWSKAGLRVLRRLAEESGAGVRMRKGRQWFRHPVDDPFWMPITDDAKHVDKDALPDLYADGIELTAPLVDMSMHLPWLTRQLDRAGVEIRRGYVDDLSAVEGDVVVNCTGLGARELCGDDAITPIRGQVVLVEQCGVDEWTTDDVDEEHPSYVIPRETTVVCGGTALAGVEDTEPDPHEAERILRDAAQLEPKIREARVVRHAVGLRPGRTEVRLSFDGRVLHCYGHGGGGVTLAHGCAEDIVATLPQP